MFSTLKKAWTVKELRKKILYTILLILLFRVGSFIPVPGIDKSVLAETINNTSFLKFFDSIAGGALSNASIFAMSITPYISASIIIQLLGVAIPALDKLRKEGGESRKRVNRYTKYITIFLALVQAIGYYITFAFQGIVTTSETNWWINVLTPIAIISSFVAGTSILMWLCDKITEKGLGNGSSMIIFAGIVSRIPSVIISLYQKSLTDSTMYAWIAVLLVAMLIIISAIVFIQEAERRISVQYAKKVVGRKMYGGQSTHIPMKIAAAGVIPIIFAITLTSFPIQIMTFLGYNPEGGIGYFFKNYIFDTNSVGFVIVYCLLIFAFTFFYTTITFNPVEVANNLKKNGGFIPGVRAGKPTADYLQGILNKLTFAGSIFLVLIAMLPYVAELVFPFSVSLGGTSLLIIVGVALETRKQLESQMLMKSYKGFLD